MAETLDEILTRKYEIKHAKDPADKEYIPHENKMYLVWKENGRIKYEELNPTKTT